MKNKRWKYLIIPFIILVIAGILTFNKFDFHTDHKVGQPIDSLNRVIVYHNGWVANVSGRTTLKDGYNLGLKYQCVEFVKRYYYEHLNHKMPNSYGHAKDFFDKEITDGQKNISRNLNQYSNPSPTQPKVDDLLIFTSTFFNIYGHVAIISKVTDKEVEIIQQNGGPFNKSRETFSLEHSFGKWKIQNKRILGWLRKK